MSLIHGSRGLIYFVHQFKPVFREPALLDDSEMLAAVTAINQRIHQLAPVLNSPSITNGVTVQASAQNVPIAWMMKRRGDATYIFAVNMRDRPTRGLFGIRDLPGRANAEVLDESRKVAVMDGEWTDEFSGYAVHLYRVEAAK